VAVDDVSFDVHAGEIFGLLGTNGTGKSSILGAIASLIPLDRGTITVLGMPHTTRASKAMLGVVLQDNAFPRELTVHEVVQLYQGIYGLHWSSHHINQWLEEWGIAKIQSSRAHQLSGGQRQRLALAIALIHEPRIAVFDEPTTGLDPELRHDLWSRIAALRSDSRAVILTTHAPEEAEALCDRIAIVSDGHIVALDNPKELVSGRPPHR
jgi:ABC-2 type transport system ATP-binding protein